MSNEQSRFAFGGTQYPLDPNSANTLLQDADPALYIALAYFESVLTTALGDRFVAECAKDPALPIAALIAETVPYDPVPYLVEQQFKFPLLALYRVDEDLDDRTNNWAHRACRWNVNYILPPLTGAQLERVAPILKTIGDVLTNRIIHKFDPAYNAGQLVWGPDGANLESIGLVAGTYGRFDGGGNLFFPCYLGKLLVKERAMPPTAGTFDKFDGADIEEHVASPEQPTLLDVVQIATHPAPTVTVCTPNQGSLAGGTSVTLTGTGFLANATVTIGGLPATGVTVVSATSITCTTPAGTGPVANYQVTVVVTNISDSLSGKLPLGFTYT